MLQFNRNTLTKAAMGATLAMFGSASFASDTNVEEPLYKMRSAYKAVKTASYTVKTESNTPNGPASFHIEALYRSPRMLRVTSKRNDSVRTIISDGKKIYVVSDDDDGGGSTQDFDLDAIFRAIEV